MSLVSGASQEVVKLHSLPRTPSVLEGIGKRMNDSTSSVSPRDPLREAGIGGVVRSRVRDKVKSQVQMVRAVLENAQAAQAAGVDWRWLPPPAAETSSSVPRL